MTCKSKVVRVSVIRLCLVLFVVVLVDAGCVVRRLWIDKGGMDDVDTEECAALSTPLRAQFTFSASVNRYASPGVPGLFCGIGGRGVFFPRLFTRLTVYGIADRSTQDAIVEAVKKAARPGFKPIIIGFYERELWSVHYGPDGLISGESHDFDKEKLLREAVLR